MELVVKATDKASGPLNKVGKSTDNLGKTAKSSTINFKAMGAAVAATAAVIGVKAVKDFAAFEKKMREVSTLTQMNEATFQRLSGQVENLATTMGVDATEAAGALYQAISAGVPEQNALSFLEVASKAAIGGITDTETAVDGLTTILNAFKIPASDTQKVADAMFATVKMGKTTFEQLSRSMFNAGPIAAALGVDFRDVLGATASLTKQGTPTSVAMTQIRAALTALSAPSKDLKDVFAQLNVSGFDELLKKEGSLVKVFGALRKATGDNKEQLQKMFGSVEAVAAILGTTGANAQMAAGDLKAVTESAGAATEAFNTMEKSTDRSLKKINAFIDDMSRALGSTLIPIVETLVDKINDLRGVIEGKTKNELEEALDKTIEKLNANVNAQERLRKKIDAAKNSESELMKVSLSSYNARMASLKEENKLLQARSEKITASLDAQDGYIKSANSRNKKIEEGAKKAGQAEADEAQKTQQREDKKNERWWEQYHLRQKMRQEDADRALEEAEAEDAREEAEFEAGQEALRQEAATEDAQYEDMKARQKKFLAEKEAEEKRSTDFQLGLMGDMSKVGMAFAKKNSAAHKAFAIAGVITSAARASMAAFEPPPTGYGPMLAPFKVAMIAAMGAAQIAKISKAKAFHSGGLVTGNGEVPAVLESGEFVVRKEAVSALGEDSLQAINEGNSNVSVVNFFDTDSLDEYLSSYKGKQAIINAIDI